jgi:hypothetical protein
MVKCILLLLFSDEVYEVYVTAVRVQGTLIYVATVRQKWHRL